MRILLFRECEWRGRKLLFDSLAVHRNNRRCSNGDNNNETPSYCRNVAAKNRRDNDPQDTATPCEVYLNLLWIFVRVYIYRSRMRKFNFISLVLAARKTTERGHRPAQ